MKREVPILLPGAPHDQHQYTNPAPSIVPFTLAPGEPITIVRRCSAMP